MNSPNDPACRARGEIPNQQRRTVFRIEGPRVSVVVVTPDICRIHAHWDGQRNHVCTWTGGVGSCAGHDRGWPTKVEDWVQILDPASSYAIVQLCRLTPASTERGPNCLWDHDGRLDGRVVWLWREPARPHGVIFARLVPNDNQDYALAPAVTPEVEPTIAQLRRMCGARLRRIPARPQIGGE